MAHYTLSNQQEHAEAVAPVADPSPLGLSALAFTTAILGCIYAGFIIPRSVASISIAVAAFLIGGFVQILAGMWEFRKGNTLAATIFSAYGGFLMALGVLFLPGFGILAILFATGIYPAALGLFFLCWTIFTGVLLLAALRTNMALVLVLALLFVGYLFLTIGQLTRGSSTVVLAIGGWFSIACAVVAWYVALADLLRAANSPMQLPTGQIRWGQQHHPVVEESHDQGYSVH
jgi:succinate-acetate transporter protein